MSNDKFLKHSENQQKINAFGYRCIKLLQNCVKKKSKQTNTSSSGKNTKTSSTLSVQSIPGSINPSKNVPLPKAKPMTTRTTGSYNAQKKAVVPKPTIPGGNSTMTSSSNKQISVGNKKKKAKGKSSDKNKTPAASVSNNSTDQTSKDKDTAVAEVKEDHRIEETITAATGGSYKYSLRIDGNYFLS